MNLHIAELLSGARDARGTAVIIDVFRAFSVECYLFSRGAARVVAVGAVETAYEWKRKMPDALLVGERKGFPLPGFDCGNSPALLAKRDVAGKTVIHTTSAGTQGLAAASGAEEILAGSLANAAAVAEYLRTRAPAEATLVAMGVNAVERADEDLLCARYIESILLGKPFSPEYLAEQTLALKAGTGERFFHPEHQAEMPEEDFYLCTKTDIFPFVLRAEAVGDTFEMHRIDL